jgi:hypothetical protein
VAQHFNLNCFAAEKGEVNLKMATIKDGLVKFDRVRAGQVIGKYEGKTVVPNFKVVKGEEWLVRLKEQNGCYIALKGEPNVAVALADGDDLAMEFRCGDIKDVVKARYVTEATDDGYDIKVVARHPRYGLKFLPMISFTYSDLLDLSKVSQIMTVAAIFPPPPNRRDLVAMAKQITEELYDGVFPLAKDYYYILKDGQTLWLEPLPELPPKPIVKPVGTTRRLYRHKRDIPPDATLIEKLPSGDYVAECPEYDIINLNEIRAQQKAIKDWWENLNIAQRIAIYWFTRHRKEGFVPSADNILRDAWWVLECANPLTQLELLRERLAEVGKP